MFEKEETRAFQRGLFVGAWQRLACVAPTASLGRFARLRLRLCGLGLFALFSIHLNQALEARLVREVFRPRVFVETHFLVLHKFSPAQLCGEDSHH